MTKHYRVTSVKNRAWSRIIAAESSFEARRIVAAAVQGKLEDFYAVPI